MVSRKGANPNLSQIASHIASGFEEDSAILYPCSFSRRHSSNIPGAGAFSNLPMVV